MTFQEIFRSSFIENLTSISFFDMAVALILALLLGIFVYYVYQKTYTGIMYSASFGTSLIGMTLVTTMLIMTVVSNVVLSLGMVGALSIVRFRSAIKEPLDIVFLFWSIAIGIVLAAGLIPLAVFGSLFIGLMLVVMSRRKSIDRPYLLVIHLKDNTKEKEIIDLIAAHTKRSSLKNKSISSGITELDMEVRLKDEDVSFIDTLDAYEAIEHVALISYNGEYLG